MTALLVRFIAVVLLGAVGASSVAQADAATNVCDPSGKALRNRDVVAICQHGRDWISAFKDGDIDRLMRLYRPDAQVALHGQRKLNGIAEIRAFFSPALAAHPRVEFLLHVEDIRIRGDMAYLISRYWFTSETADGKKLQDAGRSLLVYQRERSAKRAGPWQIQVDIDQATPDVSFPPPASAR